jgi:hypothetical protein
VGRDAAAAQGEGRRHGGRVLEFAEIEWIGGGWLAASALTS